MCATSTKATEPLRELAEDPASWLPRLGEQMREYWKLAIEPHWPRIRALLEGDVMYRARQLALGGAELLFADLHPAVSFADGVISIDKHHEGDVRPEGQGLLMIRRSSTGRGSPSCSGGRTNPPCPTRLEDRNSGIAPRHVTPVARWTT
jgi:hypothetical protein